MRRLLTTWGAVWLVLAMGVVSPTVALGVTRHARSWELTGCGDDRLEPGSPDFNHDGDSDFVIGLPGAGRGVGAIEVVERGHQPVIYRPGTHGIPPMPAGSRFGSTSEVFDANGDGCDDLLVSAPGLAVDGVAGAGGVAVMLGGPRGLTGGPVVTQSGAGVPGTPVVDGHFGAATFAHGYSPPGGGGFPPPVGNLLDVGVPGATVPSGGSDPSPLRQAGEVVSFYLSPKGQVVQPSNDPVETMPVPTAGAHFGTAIGDDYVTAPDASSGTLAHAGYVRIWDASYYGRKAGERLGATASVGPASYDADKLYGLYVGAPGYRVGAHSRAGAVDRFDVEFDGPYVLDLGLTTQATHGVPGAPQTGARFGAVISVGFPVGSAFDAQVAIGAPGATVGGKRGAGRVDVNYFKLIDAGPNGYVSKGWTSDTQATRYVPGAPQSGAGFGDALSFFSLRQSETSPLRLIIGIPGVRHASGQVQVTPLGLHGPTTSTVDVLRRTGGPRANDQFGGSLDGEIDRNVN
jgi:hypothetical protein